MNLQITCHSTSSILCLGCKQKLLRQLLHQLLLGHRIQVISVCVRCMSRLITSLNNNLETYRIRTYVCQYMSDRDYLRTIMHSRRTQIERNEITLQHCKLFFVERECFAPLPAWVFSRMLQVLIPELSEMVGELKTITFDQLWKKSIFWSHVDPYVGQRWSLVLILNSPPRAHTKTAQRSKIDFDTVWSECEMFA